MVYFRHSKITTKLTFFSRFNSPTTHITRVFGGRYQACFSTLVGTENEIVVKVPLAESLASIGVESLRAKESRVKEKPQTVRVNMKRFLEMKIKKRVKQHYVNGMFHDLFRKVVADPRTLMDAYDCIRVYSNVDLNVSEDVGICFESLSEELVNGKFDVECNTFSVSTKGKHEKGVLVLPGLKLKIVQEAMRIVLEVVFRPHFSKISHGCRSGRGRLSALRYICKETGKPNFWFTVSVSKKVDSSVLAKLISTIEDKITDPHLSEMIQTMFDARALNFEFGNFPKGQGLPQEGILSPVLMNIYLDLFDDEFYKMSMRFEALYSTPSLEEKQPQSKLRNWFRRQMKSQTDIVVASELSGVRVHCCRFMDEIFFAVSGPIDTARSLECEVQNYIKNSLLLDTHNDSKIFPSNHNPGIHFCGTYVAECIKDNSHAVKAVHKLRDKVTLFALQREEAWNTGTIRIGKKVLGHGLKKVKESEIEQLSDKNSVLSKISKYRKAGMETDHWYQHLLKIWMQDLNNKAYRSEEYILSKCIGESSLPPTLRDSFYEFQRLVKEYKSTETKALLALLPSSSLSKECLTSIQIRAPVHRIQERLRRYGIVNARGHGCAVRTLILQDKSEIVEWFSGIVRRWVKCYSESENFEQVKHIISREVRMSCIRTLAVKYRTHESIIEKHFELELCSIPLCQDVEGDISEDSVDLSTFDYDEGFMYGFSYSGACQLSLARLVSDSSPCNCFVFGCSAPAPCIYTLHVLEKQKFSSWNTGFSTCIHPSLRGRQIGLCKRHLTDLYLGDILLQCIDFRPRV